MNPDQPTHPKIGYRFTAQPHENGEIHLTTEILDGFEGAKRQLGVEIMRTKEKAVREALIALGWTPPDNELETLSRTTRFDAQDAADCLHEANRECGTCRHWNKIGPSQPGHGRCKYTLPQVPLWAECRDFGQPGTTMSQGPGDGKPRHCRKCQECGHSFVPFETKKSDSKP